MNTLLIGDLHLPYQHPDAFDFLDALQAEYQCERIVSIGDEADIHHNTWHQANPDALGPEEEYRAAFHLIQTEMYPRWPKLQICNSNHGMRYARIMKLASIPQGVRQKLTPNRIWDVPSSWKWSDKVTFKLGNGSQVVCEHGDKTKKYQLRARAGLSYNTVAGHYHLDGGVIWYRSGEGLNRFAAQTGCLIDFNKPAFAYSHNEPVLGSLVIVDDVPIFHPLKTNKKGRWVGHL